MTFLEALGEVVGREADAAAILEEVERSQKLRRRLGSMLGEARNFMIVAPWMATFPGLAIFVAVIGFNLMGDGLREAIDPHRRRL